MSTLEELKNGLERAWDQIAEGWRELSQRASHALTRFHPIRRGDAVETGEDQLAARGARWGLLAAEVRVTDDAVRVALEAPGMNPEDFDIEVLEGVLVVRGRKQVEREAREGHYYVMERAYGAFERAIPLPVDVDDTRAEARYRKGVLEITIPRSARDRVRRITVQTG